MHLVISGRKEIIDKKEQKCRAQDRNLRALLLMEKVRKTDPSATMEIDWPEREPHEGGTPKEGS